MFKIAYIRILNGLAINYSIIDFINYLIFFLNKIDFNDFRKIESAHFKIKNVVISLPFRQDRRKYIQHHLHNQGIPFHFFDAIHGKTQINKVGNIIKISSNSAKYMSSGSLGCLASHLQLWKELIKSQYNGYLIFEDDIILFKNNTEIEDLIKTFPIDFDLVYLGSKSCTSWLNMKQVSFNLSKPFSIRKGAYCYLISKNGAIKILKHFKEVKITCGGIDSILGILSMRNKINVYQVTPSICDVRLDFPSNIYNRSTASKTLHKIEN